LPALEWLPSRQPDSGLSATFADAQAALANITSRKQARFVSADLPASKLPALASHATWPTRISSNSRVPHGLKLATLDNSLCQKSWALGVAENPL